MNLERIRRPNQSLDPMLLGLNPEDGHGSGAATQAHTRRCTSKGWFVQREATSKQQMQTTINAPKVEKLYAQVRMHLWGRSGISG